MLGWRHLRLPLSVWGQELIGELPCGGHNTCFAKNNQSTRNQTMRLRQVSVSLRIKHSIAPHRYLSFLLMMCAVKDIVPHHTIQTYRRPSDAIILRNGIVSVISLRNKYCFQWSRHRVYFYCGLRLK